MQNEMTRSGQSAHGDIDWAIFDNVVGTGDISKLTPQQRVSYYRSLCESVGLNPMTLPFEYIAFQGKLRLYTKREATDQLRKIHGVSITKLDAVAEDGIYVVTAHAVDASGRTDASKGAVAFGNLQGEARANAIMKAEAKAKRRVTLSICGLGMLDESEVDSIPGAQRVRVNMETGEVIDPPTPGATHREQRSALTQAPAAPQPQQRTVPPPATEPPRQPRGSRLTSEHQQLIAQLQQIAERMTDQAYSELLDWMRISFETDQPARLTPEQVRATITQAISMALKPDPFGDDDVLLDVPADDIVPSGFRS